LFKILKHQAPGVIGYSLVLLHFVQLMAILKNNDLGLSVRLGAFSVSAGIGYRQTWII
jgi:hypothetical protein